MSKINVNTVDTQCGSTLTLGSSGKTVTLASGASQSGFGRTGTVDWCTTAKTSPFTAVSGDGYFVNTTSGAVTVTLPASPSAGDIVSVADYTGTAATNKITLGRNSSKINGACSDFDIEQNDSSVTLIYVDGTEGWRVTKATTPVVVQNSFMSATGGTITTCGDFKIHTFTTDGCFSVTEGAVAANNFVSYTVVAGGGGGGGDAGGGGGGGGFREGKPSNDPYTASPLDSGSALPVSGQTYPITVGGGGTAGAGQGPTSPNAPQGSKGGNGSNSVFSTITSAGGGGGAKEPTSPTAGPNDGQGLPGGSGGGGSYTAPGRPLAGKGGTGNTPPVSPAQGKDGGAGPIGTPSSSNSSSGGGGATEAGLGTNPGGGGGAGGAGATTNITGSPVAYSGGGGGAGGSAGPGGAGGTGGGGGGGPSGSDGTAGTTNTGGGGGGGFPDPQAGGAGGSGIVILRYKFQ